jgi:hypothetical protein
MKSEGAAQGVAAGGAPRLASELPQASCHKLSKRASATECVWGKEHTRTAGACVLGGALVALAHVVLVIIISDGGEGRHFSKGAHHERGGAVKEGRLRAEVASADGASPTAVPAALCLRVGLFLHQILVPHLEERLLQAQHAVW